MHYGAGSVPHTIIELLPQFGSAVYKVAPDTRVVSRMLYSQAPWKQWVRVGSARLQWGFFIILIAYEW